MAFFNKSVQSAAASIQNEEGFTEQQAPLDITHFEKPLYESASKIKSGVEKNHHLIKIQRSKLEELKKGLENIEFYRNGALGQINGGGVRDAETLKDLAKQVEEHNVKMLEQQGLIDRLQLDISLLEQEKDQAGIDDLLKQWEDYEKRMFSEFISPMEAEVRATKEKYFSWLKELRFMYTRLENLAMCLNDVLGDGEKVYVHSWLKTIQIKPELQITQYDQAKEEAILNTYRAE